MLKEVDKHAIQKMFMCNRVDVLEKKTPANIQQARTYSESHRYLAALFRELNAFHQRGATEVPEDIDIHDILSELILQLMPLLSRKYKLKKFIAKGCPYI